MLEKNPKPSPARPAVMVLAALALVVAGVGALLLLDGGESDELLSTAETEADAIEVTQPDGVPDALFAAEAWAVAPTGENLQALFESVGGLEALELAAFEGSYDLVTFDPGDPDRILGSARDAYNDIGENQDLNTVYTLAAGEFGAELYAPDVVHDSANFEDDGSVVLWARSRSTRPSPRTATVVTAGGQTVEHRRAIFIGQWAADSGAIITVAPMSPAPQTPYSQLIIQTADGESVELELGGTVWVDSPEPGVFGTYSNDGGAARFWSSADGSPLPDHPLAGRPITRSEISADGSRAITTQVDGTVEVIDTGTGDLVATLGQIDVGRVRDPLRLNADGTIAITLGQSGTVRLFHVDSSTEIFSFDSFVAPHRTLTETNSTSRTSVVAPGATRMAHLTFGDAMTWTIIDTDVASWATRACDIAGRSLTADEREAGGFPSEPGVCG